MTSVVQSYMGIGWNGPERRAARAEAPMAHPQWEREPATQSYAAPNSFCPRCLVRWRAEGYGPTACWSCGGVGIQGVFVGGTAGGSTLIETRAGEHPYPRALGATPDACTCDDPTVLAVAGLVARGAEPYDACRAVYARAEAAA